MQVCAQVCFEAKPAEPNKTSFVKVNLRVCLWEAGCL